MPSLLHYIRRLADSAPLRALAAGSMRVAGLRAAGAGLAFGLQIALARWMGPADYGVYTFALSGAVVLALFGALGLPDTALRFVPEYRSTNQPGRLAGFVAWARRSVGGASIALAAAGAGAVLLLDPSDRPSLLVALAYVPALTALQIEAGLLKGLRRASVAVGLTSVAAPLGMGTAAGLIVWAQGGLSSPVALGLLVGTTALLALALRGLADRSLPRAVRTASDGSTPETDRPAWRRVAGPLLLVGGFVVLLNRTDVLMVGLLVGTTEAGLFGVAARVAEAVSLLWASVNLIVAPSISEEWAAGNREALQAEVRRAAWLGFVPSAVVAGVLALAASFVLGLFGPAFRAAEPALLLLVASNLSSTAVGPVQHLLTLTGHQKAVLPALGTCVGLNAALTAVGAWAFGLSGAALATLATTILSNLWLYRLVRRRLGIQPSLLPPSSSPSPPSA